MFVASPVDSTTAAQAKPTISDNVAGYEAVVNARSLVCNAKSGHILLSLILNGDSRFSGYTLSAYHKTLGYKLRKYVQLAMGSLRMGSGFNGLYHEVDAVEANDQKYVYFPAATGRATWTKYNWLDSCGRRAYKCLNTVLEPMGIVFDPAQNASSTPTSPFGWAKYLEIYTTGTSKDGSGLKTGGGGRFTWAIYQGAATTANIAALTVPALGTAAERLATGQISTNTNIADNYSAYYAGTRSGILNAAAQIDPTVKALLVIYPDVVNAAGGFFIVEGINSYVDEVTIAGGVVTQRGGIQVHDCSRTGATLRWIQGYYTPGSLLPFGPEWQANNTHGWLKPFNSDSSLQDYKVKVMPQFDHAILIENADINDVLGVDGTTPTLANWQQRIKAGAHEVTRANVIWLKVSDVAGRGVLGLDTSWIYAANGTSGGNLAEFDAAFDSVMNASSLNRRFMARLDYRKVKGGGDYTSTSGVQGDGSVDCIHEADTGVGKKANAIIGMLDVAYQDGLRSNGQVKEVGAIAVPSPNTLLWFDSSRHDTLKVDAAGTQVPTVVELNSTFQYWLSKGSTAWAVTEAVIGNAPVLTEQGKRPGLMFTSQQLTKAIGSQVYDYNLGFACYFVATLFDQGSISPVALLSTNGLHDMTLNINGGINCISASTNAVANIQKGVNVGSPNNPSAPYGVPYIGRHIFRPSDQSFRFRRGPTGSVTGSGETPTFGEYVLPTVVFGDGLKGIKFCGTAGGKVIIHEWFMVTGEVSDGMDAAIYEQLAKKWKVV